MSVSLAQTKKLSRRTTAIVVCVALLTVLLLYLVLAASPSPAAAPASSFDGNRAYGYLKKICDFGPRPSGSTGMLKQRKFLVDYFEKAGGQVTVQNFVERHPQTGANVELANVIVEWHPERPLRIVLAAHYDTRPFPDRDPVNPRGTFIGANDGASGVAVLMELAREMPDLKGTLGVDMVLFDGEEFVFSERDRYFLGSEYFARNYVHSKPAFKYRWGVLLDMVGDANLAIPYEGHGISWQETAPLVSSIWTTARRLKVKEFLAVQGREVRDDHLAMRNIAGIPTCDIIDFDYPAWHTTNDTPDQCSAASLGKVGTVVLEWLKTTSVKGRLR